MDEPTEDSFVRPFIASLGETGPAAPVEPVLSSRSTTDAVEADEGVRPYLLTGGRVHDSDDAVEKTYLTVARTDVRLSREHEQVMALCVDAQSVAEISAHLDLPLGVAAVLARDLLDAGVLVTSNDDVDAASDVSIIMRLKDAIRAL